MAAMHVASGWAQTTTQAARTASTGTPARATMASVSMPRSAPPSDLPLADFAVSACDERGDGHQPGLHRREAITPRPAPTRDVRVMPSQSCKTELSICDQDEQSSFIGAQCCKGQHVEHSSSLMAWSCIEEGLTQPSHDDFMFTIRNLMHMIHEQLLVVYTLAVAVSYQRASSLERRESQTDDLEAGMN